MGATVDLLKKLAAPPAKRATGKSIMDVWVDSRPEVEQQAIIAAANNPAWGHVALLNALVAEGAPNMSDTAFRQWRIKVGLA
jgi:hypothetical protein